MSSDPALRRMIIQHEGWRAFAYKDTASKLTIGVGRNLSDRGLAADEIDLLLDNDLELALAICVDLFGSDFAGASVPRRHALISMAFNLGGPRLAKFIRLRAAIKAGDWQGAAHHALDSRWASQTGGRARHIAQLISGPESPKPLI
ncbi:lysozyme [Alphaproteobacteria bacterium]|jgi:lysozyme|nr:lysozyme [Alphaproteobacteria bacterium]